MSNFTHMSANEQWRTRPADQRFTSLTALQAAAQFTMDHSAAKVIPSKALKADLDGQQLVVKGPSGQPAIPSHYAFGQLANRAGAPAGYLRELAPELAVDCLNYGLQVLRPVEDIGVLLYKNGGPAELHAVTGPNYGRIWNARAADALVAAFGDGVTGKFKVPGEFGKPVPITTENTTLYASDRDMVVFLADESHHTEISNRRDGKPGVLSTGVAFGNSDVGAGRMWCAHFSFDYFCCNRIIHGMHDLEEFSIRHTASAPHRFMSEVVPALKAIAAEGFTLKAALIAAAQQRKIDDVDKFLKGRKFSGSQISGIKAAFKTDEGYDLGVDLTGAGINSATIWNTVTGITAYARSLQYQDARIDLEREAGKILQLAN